MRRIEGMKCALPRGQIEAKRVHDPRKTPFGH
jgi:hypothetical protein